MGAPKQKWTSEEEEALKAGIEKHGAGKWRTIQKDPEFSRFLSTRSNIDLKDKWRNMNVSAGGHGPREKTRIPKPKGVSSISASSSQSHADSTPLKDDRVLPGPDSAKNSQDVKVPRYNTMIIEALTAMKEPHGSEIGAIYGFIELRHEVPANFRRLLSSKLRRLVQQNKIEKVQKCYRLKASPVLTKTPSPKQKVPTNHPRPPQNTGFRNSEDLIEEAWSTAAYKIADAEAKSFLASEAVKELERVSRMAEEQEALLLAISEICLQKL